MTKKDYERAAWIIQRWAASDDGHTPHAPGDCTNDMISAFVEFFEGDNTRFDAARFRRACVPGANVRART